MNEYVVLTAYKKVGRKKDTVPLFDIEFADGFQVEDGCLFFFNLVDGTEEVVKAYGVGGWLEVERSEDE